MLKRLLLFLGIILGICGIFYLAYRINSSTLWIIVFIAVGILTRNSTSLLSGGNSGRIFSYFKRRPAVRMELVKDILARKQSRPDDLGTEEAVAFLVIAMAQESINEAYSRASELQADVFNDDFFQYMKRVLNDLRMIGLNRKFQLQLVSFGENLARTYQLREWEDEFRQQREAILKRHVESIPVIRYPR